MPEGSAQISGWEHTGGFARRGGVFRSTIDSRGDWREEAAKRLLSLADLPAGWDGYRAKPVSPDAISFALDLLNDLPRYSRVPVPSVVPSPEGGVQLEWHDRGIDAELYIAGPYDCDLWWRNRRDGLEYSFALTDDYSAVLKPLWFLNIE